jgi:hypothetical protein
MTKNTRNLSNAFSRGGGGATNLTMQTCSTMLPKYSQRSPNCRGGSDTTNSREEHPKALMASKINKPQRYKDGSESGRLKGPSLYCSSKFMMIAAFLRS